MSAPWRVAWPLHVYLGLLVLLFVVAAGAAVFLARSQSRSDARAAALDDADFAARATAAELGSGVNDVRAFVAGTAASPALAGVFEQPQGCTLSFTRAGALQGYIAAVDTAGTVACSSLPEATASGSPGYGGTAWLAQALAGPILVTPVLDPITGRKTAVFAAPIDGLGAFVAVIDLEPIGPGLAQRYGGARGLEFIVVDDASGTLIARSVEPERWVGESVAGTPLAGSELPGRDLDGTARLYRRSLVQEQPWTVLAGADRDQALAASDRLFRRQVAVIAMGLLIVLAAAGALYIGVTRPIRRLSLAARAVDGTQAPMPVRLGGPREVAALAADFNRLSAAVDHELAVRRQAEEDAHASERNYRLLFEGNPQPMWVFDLASGEVLEVNDAATSRYGYTREELLGLDHLKLWDDAEAAERAQRAIEAGSATRMGPLPHVTKDGARIDVLVSGHGTTFADRAACLVIAEDVTEKERLESQLRRAQRLESLGQLAGGVAHDFNNLLTVILNYSSFVKGEIEEAAQEEAGDRWQAARHDLGEVEQAALRAARLTRQLLLFARREVAQPRVVILNEAVRGMEDLLRRTLGEHLSLVTSLADDLLAVRIDPGQLDQVLVNLAVNARDAMGDGGTLAIDTDNIDIDETFAATQVGLSPGSYVRLRVSDSGAGMEQSVIDHAFEPFYTTKADRGGTGLGLATVYGIVTAAGGTVRIYSEVGHGTTVTILLPASTEAVTAPAEMVEPDSLRGTETVLMVEDEEAVLEVATRILEGRGYSVLTAASGAEAFEVARSHQGDIDLLVTDVVMPHMLGTEVARELMAARPGMRVLYTSGYAQPVLGARGTLDAGVILLDKPFSEVTLLTRVREALEGGR